ncbi:MAG: AMP-binding protein [Bacteroidetes bacterium]|jgi:long-chain acyl-CoA synthetase|nr:AMP-binding protein [Bacteroidota bacterium]
MPILVAFDTMPQLFTRLADHYAGRDRPALRYKDKYTKAWVDISWDEVYRRMRAFAGFLHARGVRPGDRVAILSENRPEWALTDMGTQLLGAVNVALYPTLPPAQARYILEDSGATVLVASTTLQFRKAKEVFDACPALETVVTMSEPEGDLPAHIHRWEDAIEEGWAYWQAHEDTLAPLADEVTPEDLCALIYTSGTTGQPKGVMLTHRNLCSNAKAAHQRVDFGPDDHHLSFLPLCHSFERTAGYTAVLAAGATVSYAESIDAIRKNLPEVNPTVMISVPRLFEKVYTTIAKKVEEGSAVQKTLFDWAVGVGRRYATTERPGLLLKAQYALAERLVFSTLHEKLGGNLRFAVSGGAPLPKKIGEFFQAAGIVIIEGYGLTETAPVLTISPMEAPRFGTVGHVVPGTTIGIQRLDDNRLAGRVRGDDYPTTVSTDEGEIVAKGPNIMAGYWNNPEATQKAIDAEGWFHTGDVGQFVEGYLAITDRIKHMIVSKGGKNIYPGPIEEEFTTVRWIDQLLVVGEGRAFLTALVVPDMEALAAFCNAEEITYSSDAELLQHPKIRALFAQAFKDYSRQAAAHEKIRDFTLVPEPFSVENGMLTPTMKPKRPVIERRYADVIDAMYAPTA